MGIVKSEPVAGTAERDDVARTMEIIRALMAVTDAANAVVAQVLAEFDVTPSTAGVLWAIGPGGDPPTMREVAGRLSCDPSTISLIADKLVDGGFATRRPHATDGRKRTLALTERGLELWDALAARLHEAGVFAALDAEEQERLLSLLAKASQPLSTPARHSRSRR